MKEASNIANVQLEITWKPFFLNIDTPKEGLDLLEYLISKYGQAAVTRFNSSGNPLDLAGAKVGITFNKNRRVINTVDCHRIMEWCNQSYPSISNQLMEKMFQAYFENGTDISRSNELLTVVGSCGLNESEAERILQSNQYRDEVIAFDRQVKSKRVSGVPFFIIESNVEGKKPVQFSGAQVCDDITKVQLTKVQCKLVLYVYLITPYISFTNHHF